MGPPSLNLYAPQPGETAAHSEDKDTEESKSGARAGLTMTTVDRPGGEHGHNLEDRMVLSASLEHYSLN